MTWSTAGQAVRAFVDQKRPALEKMARGVRAAGRPLSPAGADGEESAHPADAGHVCSSRCWRGWKALGSRKRAQWARRGIGIGPCSGSAGSWDATGVCAGSARIVHEPATSRIVHWAADPRVDAAQLRKALDDTLAADAPDPSPLRSVQALISVPRPTGLLAVPAGLRPPRAPFAGRGTQAAGPDGLSGRSEGGRREWPGCARQRRRSEAHPRPSNCSFANWLAQVDRPAAKRAPARR